MESTIRGKHLALLCLISAINLLISVTATPALATVDQSLQRRPPLSYADVVDLADMAPMVAVVQIRSAIPLPPDPADGVPKGFRRIYLEADVRELIRGDTGISPVVSYLYDIPLDSRGRIPKLKKAQMVLFARNGTVPGQIQLVARDAQIAAAPDDLQRVKSILSSLVAEDAPPRIIGLGDAFHVAGTVAGEGETQVFLRTETGDPVSLSIVRRPGQSPHWAVALGEIVDEAARSPKPGSLLWYRLACALPPALPARSVRTLPVTDAEAARADYQVVIQALGRCERTRVAG